jgi:uncharacterized protein (DUF2147 family)
MRLLDYTAILAITVGSASLPAQTSPMLGDWREPTGSIIRIEQCPSGICLRLIDLSHEAPITIDLHNPDAAQRHRSLCNLEIGRQFHLSDPTHASDGSLYDPKSGKTYRGAIAVEGDALKLRGYLGIELFGKTEVWRRTTDRAVSCPGASAQSNATGR